jgi:CelD/BcsL family acetyltransferase involved in cellulose biosynthesis
MTIKIREIESYNEFIDLKELWQNLLLKSDHTVFSTWEWLTVWWKHFGKDKKLLLLLAEENEKPLGIAPLMYSVSNVFGFRTAKIEFIGTPNSDYNNFILTERTGQCITLFLDYINEVFQEKWESIELNDVPETSPTAHFLQKREGHLQTVSSRVLHECLYIQLPKSYDYLYSQLHYKFRQNLRRSMHNLEQQHKVELTDFSTTQRSVDGMEKLFELHQKRWKATGEPGAFADPKIRQFNLDVAQTFAQQGWLSLSSLDVDDIPVASSYGFKYNSKFYYYLHGVDPVYHRYSVGNLMVSSLLKKCIEDQLKEFDFLRGAESYKYRWTTSSRKNYNFIITKRKVIARAKNRFLRTYSFQVKKLKGSLKK